MALFLDIFGYLSVVLRGLTLLAQSFTIGGLAFQLLLLRPLQAELSAEAIIVGKRGQRLLRLSAFGWFAIVLAALAVNMAALTGTLELSLGEAAGADFARSGFAVAACALGIAWLARTGHWGRARAIMLVALVGLALAMQLNLTHAASRLDVRWPLLAADFLHMLGAGIWIGGLPYFLLALNGCRSEDDQRRIGRRYSLMSMASVAAIVLGGTIMAMAYLGSFAAIYGTAYGVMTSAKVAMLLMLLALGAGNFLAVERLRRRDPAAPLLRMKRFVEVELGIGLTVLLTAGSLTSLPPGIDLSQDRLSWSEIVERATPQWPRLSSPSVDQLTISQLQAKIDAADAQRVTAPQAYVPGEGVILPRSAADI
ncbi:MAG: CopD family protein, partial [Bradyrhizobium sp.]|nr:CopD family protein [Bradyrhizobium sp.]